MRIGHGYDAHRFTEGKKMILGGVEIDYEYGLLAHSDGDVLCHAIMDALLGAAGLGDIGALFPDTDMNFKNIYSMTLLQKVMLEIRKAGFEVEYIDSTVIAQQPKLKKYIPQIRECVAKYADIPIECYNVKATTEENMGFTGRLEGISAHAVCILKNK
jgi:2-C-methyl-D-erythritol 2,4-cyclodiphosphate synthase